MDWMQILVAVAGLGIGWIGRHYSYPTTPTPTPSPSSPTTRPTPLLDALRQFLAQEGAVAEHQALGLLQQILAPQGVAGPPAGRPLGA